MPKVKGLLRGGSSLTNRGFLSESSIRHLRSPQKKTSHKEGVTICVTQEFSVYPWDFNSQNKVCVFKQRKQDRNILHKSMSPSRSPSFPGWAGRSPRNDILLECVRCKSSIHWFKSSCSKQLNWICTHTMIQWLQQHSKEQIRKSNIQHFQILQSAIPSRLS